MSLITDLPPDLTGNWYYYVEVVRQEVEGGQPDINNRINTQFITSVTQSGRFILMTVPIDLPLRPQAGYIMGFWNKINTPTSSYWQLVMPDYDDNGQYFLTVSDFNNDIVSKLSGVYTESGFSTINQNQKPTVGAATLTRIDSF